MLSTSISTCRHRRGFQTQHRAGVANALDVDFDMPPWLRKFKFGRLLTLRFVGLALRALVDLRPRRPPVRPAVENLDYLAALLHRTGFGPLPDFFNRLGERPHLLEVQRLLLEEALKNDGAAARDFAHVGVVVLDRVTNPAQPSALRGCLTHWFHGRIGSTQADVLEASAGMLPASLGLRDATGLRFVRDVTCHSERITSARVDELRGCGLEDPDVLDLVIVVALWNSLARLEILLAGL